MTTKPREWWIKRCDFFPDRVWETRAQAECTAGCKHIPIHVREVLPENEQLENLMLFETLKKLQLALAREKKLVEVLERIADVDNAKGNVADSRTIFMLEGLKYAAKVAKEALAEHRKAKESR